MLVGLEVAGYMHGRDVRAVREVLLGLEVLDYFADGFENRAEHVVVGLWGLLVECDGRGREVAWSAVSNALGVEGAVGGEGVAVVFSDRRGVEVYASACALVTYLAEVVEAIGCAGYVLSDVVGSLNGADG